jgi:hypothetical protein
VPRSLAIALSGALAERQITLRHVTVLPHVLQTLYTTFDGSPKPTVMVVLMEAGLLMGCFYRGALRLFIEPPQDMSGRPLRDPASVTEQVERANLFLRQQFPTETVGRVLLATPGDGAAAVESALQSTLASDIVTLADAPAGSLMAMGAALDAETARPLQLLPPEVRPRTTAERWTRRLATAASLVVMAAAAWWAGSGMAVARTEADAARAVERQVQSELTWLDGARETLEARRAHLTRLAYLEASSEERAESRRIMAAVAAAAPERIRLDTLRVERDGDGWILKLTGRAEGAGSAEAVRAVDQLYRGIPERLPAEELELGRLRDLQDTEQDTPMMPGGWPVAIDFDMSFIVQWPTDSRR